MSECLNDCWICQRSKSKCSLKNDCGAVFNGQDCGMKNVCNPKRKKCPLKNGQKEFNFGGGD